jgi:hypothetical protein
VPEDYFIGVDLGQVNDFTAIVTLEGLVYRNHYKVTGLERMRSIDYTRVVKRLVDIVNAPPICEGNIHLVVDRTGVGRPIVDMMFEHNLNPIGVSITGGDKPTHEYLNQWKTRQACTVPKRDLGINLALMIQNKELKVARSLPLAQVLATEMQNMTVKINSRTGHDSYGAEKAGEHDDLVLALCLSGWWAKNKPSVILPSMAHRA